jgi:UDP-N-acetylglucosamine:LPS N-acetylglucosamine transferase
MFNKILILSASVGAGHLSAASAIEKEFQRQNAAKEIKNIDVLE